MDSILVYSVTASALLLLFGGFFVSLSAALREKRETLGMLAMYLGATIFIAMAVMEAKT
jgi:hypothetical protein